ncbi:MAG: metallophosphoesterase, partial [Proteobacteria bacterium]|nr:metallophosphoesterase [Pseudomonadota bacterium]
TGFSGPLKVEVFDTGDLDDADETPSIPIGPGYFSQNVPGSPRPDNWADWRDDFFVPAARLLTAAPWVFTRGNHELCSRAGPGWFYLLDTASPLLGAGRRADACPPQLPPGWQPGAWPPFARPFQGLPFPTEPTLPWRLRLGGLNLIVLDSSDAGDQEIYSPQHYEAIFRRVAAMLAEDDTPTWLVTHRPIWGVVRKSKGIADPGAPYAFINVTQQQAVATVFPKGMPAHVGAIVSGHMHRFQAIGFDGRRPPQLAIGNGGMELSQTFPVPSREHPRAPIGVPAFDGLTGWVVGLSDFGALDVTLQPGGAWTGRLFSPSGATLATCDSRWPAPGSSRPPCALE